MPRKPRRSFTADQSAAILRRHHVDKVPVSQICGENYLQPSVFCCWHNQLSGNAAALLAPAPVTPSKAVAAGVEALEKGVA